MVSPVRVILVDSQSLFNFSKCFFNFHFGDSQNKISILFLFYFCKIHVGSIINQLTKKSLALIGVLKIVFNNQYY